MPSRLLLQKWTGLRPHALSQWDLFSSPLPDPCKPVPKLPRWQVERQRVHRLHLLRQQYLFKLARQCQVQRLPSLHLFALWRASVLPRRLLLPA